MALVHSEVCDCEFCQINRLTETVAKQQKLLDTLTTPNVSYFDMTPAEEIAQLEAQCSRYAEVVNLVWSANMLMNPALWRDMIREKARVALNIPKP